MKESFTLVEMMIVVAIISVLATIAIPQYNKYIRKAELTEPMAAIKEILYAEKLRLAMGGAKLTRLNYTARGFNNIYEISLSETAKFRWFSIRDCGSSIIISASSSYESISGTIYYIYGNLSNYTTSKYEGKYYLYDYINNVETPNEAPIICRNR